MIWRCELKTATKSQKQRMQRTKEKQRRKGLAKTESQKRHMKSDSSKTPGETKPKRTGLKGGGGTRLFPRIGGGPYRRTTVSQRIRDILE